ncbi:hypothetical protein HK101_009651 [Irineochytrium annulatum]|nr:hypothetical protein HK101_009651 [Irineochytrium annulatum]
MLKSLLFAVRPPSASTPSFLRHGHVVICLLPWPPTTAIRLHGRSLIGRATPSRSSTIATKDLHQLWSIDEVARWLEDELQLRPVIVDAFRENKIDGAMLETLTDDDLARRGLSDTTRNMFRMALERLARGSALAQTETTLRKDISTTVMKSKETQDITRSDFATADGGVITAPGIALLESGSLERGDVVVGHVKAIRVVKKKGTALDTTMTGSKNSEGHDVAAGGMKDASPAVARSADASTTTTPEPKPTMKGVRKLAGEKIQKLADYAAQAAGGAEFAANATAPRTVNVAEKKTGASRKSTLPAMVENVANANAVNEGKPIEDTVAAGVVQDKVVEPVKKQPILDYVHGFRLSRIAEAPLVLRDYQEECLQVVLDKFLKGQKRQGISLPVGAGKTIIFSNLITRVPAPTQDATRTLVLAHRGELLDQAVISIQRAAPHLRVIRDQANREPTLEQLLGADVVVATVQTLGRDKSTRAGIYDPRLFKLVIVDEAHHASAASYKRLLENIGVFSPDSHILLLGCSATFRRHDGVSLSPVFDEVVFHRGFLNMIQQGHLCKLFFGLVQTRVSLDNVELRGGDYEGKTLGETVNTVERNIRIVKAWKWFTGTHKELRFEQDKPVDFDKKVAFGDGDIGAGATARVEKKRREAGVVEASAKAGDAEVAADEVAATEGMGLTFEEAAMARWPAYNMSRRRLCLVFAVNVAHIESLVEEFVKQGVNARGLHAGMTYAQRRDTIDDYRSGRFPVLVNCGILTEGFDLPQIDCVILARPTRSVPLLQQMIGRGLRTHSSKRDCLVVDVADFYQGGALATVPTLFGLDPATSFTDPSKEGDVAELDVEKMRVVQDIIDGTPEGEEPKLPAGTFYRLDTIDHLGDRIETTKAAKPDAHLDERMRQAVLDEMAKTEFGFELFDVQNVFTSESVIADERFLQQMTRLAWVRIGPADFALAVIATKGGSGDTVFIRRTIVAVGEPLPDGTQEAEGIYVATLRRKMVYPGRGKGGAVAGYKSVDSEILRSDTLRSALAGVETWLKKVGGQTAVALCDRYAGWRRKPASDAQKSLLTKMGVKDVQVTKGIAADLITRRKCGAKGRLQEEERARKRKEKAKAKEVKKKEPVYREFRTMGLKYTNRQRCVNHTCHIIMSAATTILDAIVKARAMLQGPRPIVLFAVLAGLDFARRIFLARVKARQLQKKNPPDLRIDVLLFQASAARLKNLLKIIPAWLTRYPDGWHLDRRYRAFENVPYKTIATTTAAERRFLIADAALARDVLTRTKDFLKWKAHRKAVGPKFSDRTNATVYAETRRACLAMFEEWDESIKEHGHADALVGNDVIAAAGFGVTLQWDDQKAEAPAGHRLTLSQAMGKFLVNLPVWFVTPKVFLNSIARNFIPQSVVKADAAISEFKQYLREFIAESRGSIEDRSNTCIQLLHLLVKASDGDDAALNDDELIGNLSMIFLAGHETTAGTLGYALAYLADNRYAQEELYEEVLRVVGDKHADAGFEQVQELQYGLAIMNETLRMMPMVPVIPRRTTTDQQLGPLVVPADSIVNILLAPMQTDPDVWGPESMTWNPDRWFPEEDGAKGNNGRRGRPRGPPKGGFLPFSEGMRQCIGKRFSQVTFVTVLAMVVRRYVVSLPEGESLEDVIKSTVMVTLAPVKPLRLVFKKRDQRFAREH